MPCGGCAARREALIAGMQAIAAGDAKAVKQATEQFSSSVRADADRLRTAALARLGARRK